MSRQHALLWHASAAWRLCLCSFMEVRVWAALGVCCMLAQVAPPGADIMHGAGLQACVPPCWRGRHELPCQHRGHDRRMLPAQEREQSLKFMVPSAGKQLPAQAWQGRNQDACSSLNPKASLR